MDFIKYENTDFPSYFNRTPLERSLERLGRAERMKAPRVFVKNELALAVRRFGWWEIAKTVVSQIRGERAMQRKLRGGKL